MYKNEIETYLQTILKKQLQKLKISNFGLYSIMDNIRNQLNSIVKHWDDEEFINAIFSTVVEEGHFYEPYINDKIGNLVVLGIRNSLLEIGASIDYKQFGLKESISSSYTKLITSSAINYFKNIDMSLLSTKIELDNDYYYDITQKYKVAYDVLVQLSKCSINNPDIEFDKIVSEPYVLDEIVFYNENINMEHKIEDIANGISNQLPPGLIKLLKGVLNKETTLFYVDSFKCLSRNFEVVLRVLQFILTHDAMFLTNNFLLTNGYVSKRKDLIRARHGDEFNKKAIQTIGEVSKKYKTELDDLSELYQ